MKILHCCLAAFYIDNYGYQENVIPKMHKLQGHDVAILASTETYIQNKTIGYIEPSKYINEHDIPVTRIPYVKYIPHLIVKKLRLYKGITNVLEEFQPEIIFLHDCQFISIVNIVRFAQNNPKVRIYVDGHTDYINSGKNWISKNILHKLIYRWCANKIEPYTRKFYGTLPLRVEFFKSVYKLPNEKVELLVFGADDSVINKDEVNIIREQVRNKLGVSQDDLVLVTGGKIDKRKYIHTLMEVVADMKQQNITLIVFGTPDHEMANQIEALSMISNIHYLGWASNIETYGYLLAGDIAIYPGTHSVLWEQSIGLGLPCIFKQWEGMNHLNIGGNCLFLKSSTREEIKHAICLLKDDKELYNNMKNVSQNKGRKMFSYNSISKKAIELV